MSALPAASTDEGPRQPEDEDPSKSTDFMFAFVPLELTVLFGLLSCLNTLLVHLVILPLRALLSSISLLRFLLFRRPMHPQEKVDLVKVLLIATAWASVRWLDISAVSGFVRKETMVKLKILFTLVELLDRLLCSYGEHILGALVWALTARAAVVRRGVAWHVLLAVGYLVLHAHLLLLHCSVFDAAINGKNQALLTLLLLVQFAEMKSIALKKITSENVLRTCADDVLERFQLVVYMALLFVYNVGKHASVDEVPEVLGDEWLRRLAGSVSVVYVSEVGVDWVKHVSLSGYNRYPPALYTAVLDHLRRRLPLRPLPLLADRLAPVSHELGLAPLPLVVVFCKVVGEWLGKPRSWRVAKYYLFLYILLLVLRSVFEFALQLHVETFPPNAPPVSSFISAKEKEKDKQKGKEKEERKGKNE